MSNHLPGWVTPIAWVALAAALVTAIAIAIDIHGHAQRRRDPAGELVWVTSALYLGPLAWVLYRRHGRTPDADPDGTASRVRAALPGGAASTVAHLVGVPIVLASGLTIAGIDLWVMILVIGALAVLVLYGLERAGAGTRGGRGPFATAAVLAVATVLAFDVGMGGWMVLLHFAELMPPATEASFWFLMQIGIILGLVTGYPVVAWSARRTRSPAAARH